MKAVIYARVSTEDQAHGASLDHQIETCRSYCKHKEYTVLAEFKEDISGTAAIRPELDKAIKMAEAYDVLVCYSLDRFARDMGVYVALERELNDAGVTLEATTGNFSDTAEGRLHKLLLMAIAEYERTQILRRTMIGLNARARDGKVTHSNTPPYGYDYVEGFFVINPEQAEIVKQIYEWYTVHKYGAGKIAKRLTNAGVPTSWDIHGLEKKRPGWGDSSVLAILKNDVYHGEFSFGDIKIKVPAIIDKRTFLKAERQRSENSRRSPRNTKHDYLMRGRMYCKTCGRMMFGVGQTKGGKLYQYYRCKGEQYGECGGGMIVTKGVDFKVWKLVMDVILNSEHYKREAERRAGDDAKDRRGQIDKLKVTISDFEEQRGRLVGLYSKGKIPEAQLDQQVDVINAELAELTYRLTELEAGTPSNQKVSDEIEVFKGNLKHLEFKHRAQIVDILEIRAEAERLGNGKASLHVTGNYEGIPIDEFI